MPLEDTNVSGMVAFIMHMMALYNRSVEVGADGKFSTMSTTTEQGRPVLAIMAVGDGVEALHTILRTNGRPV